MLDFPTTEPIYQPSISGVLRAGEGISPGMDGNLRQVGEEAGPGPHREQETKPIRLWAPTP